MKKPMQTIQKNQQGMVSILVSIIFITIIALVTTSFALLVRREQRQVLDRQLSTQAFYAAESGINDTIQKLETGSVSNTDCNMTSTILPNPVLDIASDTKYTCVLVKENPTSLEFSDIGANDSTIIRVEATSNINSIRISWRASNNSSRFADSGKFFLPQQSFNESAPDTDGNALGKNTGILRTTVIPISGGVTRDNLSRDSRTFFLYPSQGALSEQGSHDYTSDRSDEGQILNGKCHQDRKPRYCSVHIKNMTNVASKVVYLRLKGMYQGANVAVEAFSSATEPLNPLTLRNSQAVIDATGKANDVLRRIQVRVPLRNEYYYPEFALESGDDICKLLLIRVGDIDDPCVYPNSTKP